MDDYDYDEGLIGEAPCEFCGDLYPLYLLIEHQTTHLNEDQFYLEDINLPEPVLVNETAHIEPKKIEEEKQMLSSVTEQNVKQNAIPAQPLEIPKSIVETKQNVKDDAIPVQHLKDHKSAIETKKSHHKNYLSEIEEFTKEKREKLLVYGAEIDPVEDLENEKQSYKKPNNPLLSTITKEEDVIDINSLSDDDSEESLEEFWKRARDFLKRTRGKI